MTLTLATRKKFSIRKPHSARQAEIIFSPKNLVIFGGRRFGKTEALVLRIFIQSCQIENGLFWWVGVSWRSASMKKAWRELQKLIRKLCRSIGVDPENYVKLSAKELINPVTGTEIWFRSAENPDSLAGEGVHGAVVDEFSLMREIVWTEFLEATLLDFSGWVVFAGIPKGNNWAAKLFRRAKIRNGWKPLHFTSYQNPFIESSAIDEIKQNVSDRIFRQEYMAEIVDLSGSVFQKINEAIDPDCWQSEPIENHSYLMGVDWGKQNDFTVVTIFDEMESSFCYMERFNQIDYVYQRKKLDSVFQKFQPRLVIAESNSMGEPIIEELERSGYPLEPFRTTHQSKKEAIEKLALAFEKQELKIPNNIDMISELESFEIKTTKSGLIKYSAPDGSGFHDDIVMSMAFAYSEVLTGKKKKSGKTTIKRVKIGR